MYCTTLQLINYESIHNLQYIVLCYCTKPVIQSHRVWYYKQQWKALKRAEPLGRDALTLLRLSFACWMLSCWCLSSSPMVIRMWSSSSWWPDGDETEFTGLSSSLASSYHVKHSKSFRDQLSYRAHFSGNTFNVYLSNVITKNTFSLIFPSIVSTEELKFYCKISHRVTPFRGLFIY